MNYEVLWVPGTEGREYWVIRDGTRIVAILEDKEQVIDYLDLNDYIWEDVDEEEEEERVGEATA